MFTYGQDQFSALSVVKAFQVDGALKKQIVRNTVRKTTASEDGLVRVVDECQEWEVFHFDPAWKVQVHCGWNGYLPRDWKFSVNRMVLQRGLFGVKHGVSGTQSHHLFGFAVAFRMAIKRNNWQVAPRPYLMAMEMKASNGKEKLFVYHSEAPTDVTKAATPNLCKQIVAAAAAVS